MSEREMLVVKLLSHTYTPSCNDQDEDCQFVINKIACWTYAMEEGMCPYLRAAAEVGKAMP